MTFWIFHSIISGFEQLRWKTSSLIKSKFCTPGIVKCREIHYPATLNCTEGTEGTESIGEWEPFWKLILQWPICKILNTHGTHVSHSILLNCTNYMCQSRTCLVLSLARWSIPPRTVILYTPLIGVWTHALTFGVICAGYCFGRTVQAFPQEVPNLPSLSTRP